MKTYTEYEPGDIKMTTDEQKMDEVHAFLLGQILLIGLTGFKGKPGDPPDNLWVVKRHIADFLNAAHRSGIVITKAETVPAVFRDSAS